MTKIDVSQSVEEQKFFTPKIQKRILIAISVIMALGAILSLALSAPPFVPLIFFALALLPLFPLGRISDTFKNRIHGN